jgi:hypothetical protein
VRQVVYFQFNICYSKMFIKGTSFPNQLKASDVEMETETRPLLKIGEMLMPTKSSSSDAIVVTKHPQT